MLVSGICVLIKVLLIVILVIVVCRVLLWIVAAYLGYFGLDHERTCRPPSACSPRASPRASPNHEAGAHRSAAGASTAPKAKAHSAVVCPPVAQTVPGATAPEDDAGAQPRTQKETMQAQQQMHTQTELKDQQTQLQTRAQQPPAQTRPHGHSVDQEMAGPTAIADHDAVDNKEATGVTSHAAADEPTDSEAEETGSEETGSETDSETDSETEPSLETEDSDTKADPDQGDSDKDSDEANPLSAAEPDSIRAVEAAPVVGAVVTTRLSVAGVAETQKGAPETSYPAPSSALVVEPPETIGPAPSSASVAEQRQPPAVVETKAVTSAGTAATAPTVASSQTPAKATAAKTEEVAGGERRPAESVAARLGALPAGSVTASTLAGLIGLLQEPGGRKHLSYPKLFRHLTASDRVLRAEVLAPWIATELHSLARLKRGGASRDSPFAAAHALLSWLRRALVSVEFRADNRQIVLHFEDDTVDLPAIEQWTIDSGLPSDPFLKDKRNRVTKRLSDAQQFLLKKRVRVYLDKEGHVSGLGEGDVRVVAPWFFLPNFNVDLTSGYRTAGNAVGKAKSLCQRDYKSDEPLLQVDAAGQPVVEDGRYKPVTAAYWLTMSVAIVTTHIALPDIQ